MAELLISTEGLAKQYVMGATAVDALVDLTVDIGHGEFVAIMGPSGSGKSTTMHLLGCLDTPTAGRYRLDGEDVSALGPDDLADIRNSKIGFVFQSFNLLARANALQNVELPLTYGGWPRRTRREAAAEALTAVGLADRMDHMPTQLSGGQMQRVAIARGIVNKPQMLLADEPTGALDSRTGIEIMALFQGLHEDGMTVIVVTHDANVANYAERVLRFHDGRMVADERVEHRVHARDLLDAAPAEPGATGAIAAGAIAAEAAE
jgi:putative ABC transport system ATP-binding protein